MNLATELQDVPMSGDEPRSPIEHFVALGQLTPASLRPERELLKHRYLSIGGSMMINAGTGIGKSTLVQQACMLWSIGRIAFGIEPARRLKVVIIQAENDEGDLVEIRDGILRGCNIEGADREHVLSNVIIGQEDACTGIDVCQKIRALCAAHHPDLLVLDPLHAYAGVDLTRDAAGVSRFLRVWLQPILNEFRCAIIIVHHTPKPPRQQKNGSGWKDTDYAYAGSGVAELANWPRASLTLDQTDSSGVFRLIAGKRGQRLYWKNDDGGRTLTRFIAHATDGFIYWTEVEHDDIPARQAEKTPTNLLALVPALPGRILKNTLLDRATQSGMGLNRARGFLDELIESKAVEVVSEKRPGIPPAKFVVRVTAEPTKDDHAELPV